MYEKVRRLFSFQGRVRFLNGRRVGEIVIEQYVGKKIDS